MNEIKEALWKDYRKVSELIDFADSNDERYKSLLEERDKLRNELIKFEQNRSDAEIKKAQIEAEDKREKIRNNITIGTFTVSTGLSLYAIVRTFKFDQESTVTSTLGRNILNGVIPKMFKK